MIRLPISISISIYLHLSLSPSLPLSFSLSPYLYLSSYSIYLSNHTPSGSSILFLFIIYIRDCAWIQVKPIIRRCSEL
ncbi:hypothetical protein FPV67DRAFT_1530951 [Lyophyllum atratum]|nr:hypothetical protein FPV67DRAFT_1530951 [Lyophyllum atratum]